MSNSHLLIVTVYNMDIDLKSDEFISLLFEYVCIILFFLYVLCLFHLYYPCFHSFYVYVYEMYFLFFFFKQKTAYEMRISDWSSDVCSSDLVRLRRRHCRRPGGLGRDGVHEEAVLAVEHLVARACVGAHQQADQLVGAGAADDARSVQRFRFGNGLAQRSEARRVGKEGVSTCTLWWAPLL